VRFVSREFYEISTLDSIRADFLLHKLGKVNAITVQNENFIPYPNIFKKQELVLNLLKKGATPDNESAHLLFQISVEREWESVVEYLLNLFREATFEGFNIADILGCLMPGPLRKSNCESIDKPTRQKKLYVPVVNNANYNYFKHLDRGVSSNPITYIDMGFEKSFRFAVSKGNANITKLLLNAHKILPKIQPNDPSTKIITHHKVIMSSFKLGKLCDMFEKCGFELLELFYKYEPGLFYINGSIFSEFCKRGNMEFVKFMAENIMGPERNLNYFGNYYRIPKGGSENIPNFHGFSNTLFNSDKGIALKNSIESGNLDILTRLIENGFDINVVSKEGLLIACEKGHLNVVKYLIEKGADIHAVDDYPLRIACEKGYLSLVEYLVKNGANIRSNNYYALRWASSNGHINFVKYLVENGAYIHAYDNNSLKNACEKGHLNVVKYLIEKGADIHAENDYPLRIAFEKGYLSLVEYLVKDGANICVNNYYALRCASSNGHINFVKYLIENGADVHSNNNEALEVAHQSGHLDLVNHLKLVKTYKQAT
ncbi:hypothetical protein BB559_007446, partial [Furculomyces boomerangus]